MHELLLFASVPGQQHHELLQQLTGLTAAQPTHRLERHLVFKAYRRPGSVNTRIGGSQDLQTPEIQRLTKMLNGAMFYTQVVGPVTEKDFGSVPLSQFTARSTVNDKRPAEGDQGNWYDFEDQRWRLEFRDIPEPGARTTVTTRLMANATLPRGDVLTPMNAWGYRSASCHPGAAEVHVIADSFCSFVTEYIMEGEVFIHNDIVLFLYRVLTFPADSHDPQSPRQTLPALREMIPLDRSGGYVLQAVVTVTDGSNPEIMKLASQRLLGLKEQLKSAVKLEQADRLSLDTRVK
jgi:mediator of RNA polymerase II transcription subunit 18, fungi type